MEEDGVVLLAMKPNAGFGVDAAASVALCPKLKGALGVSAGASLLSAGFPNVKLGWAGSLGGSGLLKEKPIDGAGEPSASFTAALKRNPEVTDSSFFSSGFPNVKEGVGSSFSATAATPKVAPPSVVEVRPGSASPRMPNTGAAAEVVVQDVLSAEDDPFSLSWEAAGKLKVVLVVEEEEKEKPASEGLLFSLLVPPLPSATPPLALNVNPPMLG